MTVVQDHAGRVGELEEAPDAQLTLRLSDGRKLRVSADDLTPLKDGTLLLRTPIEGLRELTAHGSPVRAAATVPVRDGQRSEVQAEAQAEAQVVARDAPQVVPRVEERLQVEKKERSLGHVRVRVVPTQREETVSVDVSETHAEVERVQIGRIVEGPPPVREEGDTLIVPVLEEVLVVEKRLLLREEIRVVRRSTTRSEQHRVALRGERVEISRQSEE